MLYDHTGRFILTCELGEAFKGGIGVVDVVVGKLLALNLARCRDPEALAGRHVEGRLLVRIFPITKSLQLGAAGRKTITQEIT